uniref:Uncharacterized protein n=1 Tax=Magallana gigas TaxID=29159 RepID=K1RA86_MAGGI
MGDDFLDLFADIEEVNEVLRQCETEFLEVKFYPRGMGCPVSGCNGIMFPTKTKFTRHWEERHRIQTRKFLCPVAGCSAECRRMSDMKAHLRSKQEKDPQRLETILLKCQSVVRENKGYIDQGLFIFKGASVTEETKTVLPTVQKIAETVQSDKDRTGSDKDRTGSDQDRTESDKDRTGSDQDQILSDQDQILSDQDQPLLKRQRISLEEYRDRSTAKKESSGTSMATKTSWKDYSSLCLPVLPNTREELQSCLAWICNSMDQLGRAREIAKRRLTDLEEG